MHNQDISMKISEAPDPTEEGILNRIDLDVKSIIGIDPNAITRAIQFLNEDTLIYSAGPHIAVQELSTGKFIYQPREESDSQVTLLKVLHYKEGATTIIGEAFLNSFPTLSYQDSDEQSYFLVHYHLSPSDHIIESVISKDKSVCYTLSDSFISAWALKSQKLISYSKIPSGLLKVEALPYGDNKIILGGVGYLKYWNLCIERKAIEESDEYLHEGDALDLQFVPNSSVLIVLCSNSKLMIIREEGYSKLSLSIEAKTMAVSSQECLLGCEGEIHAYLIDKHYQLQFLNVYKLPMVGGVVSCIQYSPDELTAVVLASSPIITEVFLVQTGESVITRPFGTSFSGNGIKGISVSTGKELICSYGYDKYVRVWSYTKCCKGIAEQQFPENPCVAAIHPTGYQIAVGFENFFKIFYLLYDSLSLAFSNPKRCEAIAYSPCGKFLAFSQNNNIHVYDPYTLVSLHKLEGHTGMPQYMSWRKDYLTSICSYGTVHVWKNKEKVFDFSSTDFVVKQACYDENLNLLACIHLDGGFRVWSENGLAMNYESSEKDYVCLLLCTNLDIVVLGMKNGSIRVMLWPLASPSSKDVEPEILEMAVHIGPINFLATAYSHIFTAGKDSVIVCLTANLFKDGQIKQLAFNKEHESFNSLSLIPQPNLEMQAEKIQQLHDSIKTLESDNYEFEQQDKKYEEKISDIKANFEKEKKKTQDDYSTIVEQIENMEEEFRTKKEEKEINYANRIAVQNDEFSRTLNAEFEKYEKLKEESEMISEKYSAQREEILAMHKEIIEQCQQDYELKLKKTMDALSELQKKVEFGRVVDEDIYLEADAVFEEKIKKQLSLQKEEIDDEKKRARECLGKHAKLIRDNANVQRELQVLREKEMELTEDNKNLTIEINNLKEKLQDLELKMKDREDIIKSRENKIKDLRSLHIHLQNYRFVLDQKINSLKDERVPMEQQNKQIQEHIKKLFGELLEESSTQNATYKLLLSYKHKNSEALKTNQQLREELLNSHNSLNQLHNDLAVLLEETDNDMLMEKVEGLYCKHLGKDGVDSEEEAKLTLNQVFLKEKQDNNERIQNEKCQQEGFMKVMYKNINANKNKLEEEHNKQILLKQQENARLIKECYDLRQDKEMLHKKISDLEADIKRIKYSLKGSSVPEQKAKISVVKDTPFQEYIKKKYVTPQELYRPKNKPDFRIRSLILELEKNRTEYAKQNKKFTNALG